MRGVYLYMCYYTIAAEYTTLQSGNFNFLGSFLIFQLIWLMLKQGDFQLGKHEIGLLQPRWFLFFFFDVVAVPSPNSNDCIWTAAHLLSVINKCETNIIPEQVT